MLRYIQEWLKFAQVTQKLLNFNKHETNYNQENNGVNADSAFTLLDLCICHRLALQIFAQIFLAWNKN